MAEHRGAAAEARRRAAVRERKGPAAAPAGREPAGRVPDGIRPEVWALMQDEGLDFAQAVERWRSERVPGPLERLRDVAHALVQLDAQRVQLVGERSQIVDELRAAGMTWNAIAAAAGTTRQALMQRPASG